MPSLSVTRSRIDSAHLQNHTHFSQRNIRLIIVATPASLTNLHPGFNSIYPPVLHLLETHQAISSAQVYHSDYSTKRYEKENISSRRFWKHPHFRLRHARQK